MKTLDIVLVNYNSTEELLRCLESIRGALDTAQATIVVVDNASTDSWQQVTAAYPFVHLIRNAENKGFASAVNTGIRQGTAPYIVLLNPDTLVPPGFFRGALEVMDRHPGVAILGPKILDPDGATQGSARAFPTPLTALFGRTALLTRLFPNNPLSRRNILSGAADDREARPVDWVSGACMVVRREALGRIGPMDEQFFMYWEDADWCKRAWESGWTVLYDPTLSLTHEVGISSRTNPIRSAFEFHRSAFKLYRKHSKRTTFLLMVPILLGGLALRFLLVVLRRPG